MNRRAVITGVGVVSPLGRRFGEFAERLLAGESGVRPITAFDASGFEVQMAAEVACDAAELDRVADDWRLDRIAVRTDRKLVFALDAAGQALGQAFGDARPPRLGLSVGWGLGVLILEDVATLYNRARRAVDVGRVPLPGRQNTLGLATESGVPVLAAAAGAYGRRQIHLSACASGAMAVGEAAAWITRGWEDVVLAGAADSMVNPLGLGGFALLQALSLRRSPDACRPFHRERDGTVIGEGAAFFVLEELSHARARGVRPLAEVIGYGSSLDAHHVSAPHPEGAGARRSMARALTSANRPIVGYVNAHGTGTRLNDEIELRAIREVVGDVPIGASKSQLGHLTSAAGAVELCATLLCFTHGRCAPTAHLSTVDSSCAANHVTVARPFRGGVALSNSFGFGGQNATVILGPPA